MRQTFVRRPKCAQRGQLDLKQVHMTRVFFSEEALTRGINMNN